ncbi:MAG: glutamate mutase L [Anaerosomatales bacterium]|nr:glutamate mutase L [Anaerosomatales bacterium]MDT8433993.1 glutamate mutase L [Anaerosomatales bacterium]
MPEPRVIDVLVAEIGSTTTVLSAFAGLSGWPATEPRLLGQGVASTSVAEGDVGIGLDLARERLEAVTGLLEPTLTLATSSAAGGLRMTVHGLTHKMTAMAAREAALGAGGVVEYQTSGKLRDHDLARIEEARPGLILLAGGVEGGDTETVLHNAERLVALSARPIVVYGGNSAVAGEAGALLAEAGFRVRMTSNVYPDVDELDILPARHVIHDAFEEHITHAPGMERIASFVNGRILPTPGAVLMASEALAAAVGDLVVIDVGGATTDVHSVTDGSPEIAAIATDPEPHSKRTVEGDLGTFVSAQHVAALLDAEEVPGQLPPAIPEGEEAIEAARTLARTAAVTAVQRHAGRLVHHYTPTGRQTVARGRDLTACRLLIGTGGALTRLPGGVETLEATRAPITGGDRLLPPADALCVLDREYTLACCGALLAHFPAEAVVALMRRSAGV